MARKMVTHHDSRIFLPPLDTSMITVTTHDRKNESRTIPNHERILVTGIVIIESSVILI